VDDEPLAIQLLAKHVQQMDTLEIAGTCSNALKASEMLRTTNVDLLFLDIKMPQLTGIEFLKMLRQPPAVIFTTAYREYALDGYELDVVDYLLKPITFDRFFKAMERYYARKAPAGSPTTLLNAPAEPCIHIRIANKTHRLPVNDILYIESLKDYIAVHRTDGSSLSAKYKISELEEELKGQPFLRIHRSFIVNLQKVTAYTMQDVEIGKIELPIGNSYREYVYKKLQ
jgi:DNA-binding LytR/AlgR family response regulator